MGKCAFAGTKRSVSTSMLVSNKIYPVDVLLFSSVRNQTITLSGTSITVFIGQDVYKIESKGMKKKKAGDMGHL